MNISRTFPFHRSSHALAAAACVLALTGVACESPTDPDDEGYTVDDFVESTVTPDPATATTSDGKTYRVIRGNNQPDEILPYDWKSTFSVTSMLNSNATSEDIDVTFPVKLTSATIQVSQASGGIISPPTGGEVERYEWIIALSSGNQFTAINTDLTVTFDVWYDLPNLRREALIKALLTFVDDDGVSFTKIVEVLVAP